MSKKTADNDNKFDEGQHIVYPSHGVGVITGREKQTVAGFDIEVYVISFEQDKLILRVPTNKATQVGMRPLSNTKVVTEAMKTLKGKARVKRTMWSRRAQEYEAKINSGDPVAIAEVVRDLYRAPGQPEQSYSERQMYEAALERLVNEYALVEKLDLDAATEKLETVLSGA